MTNEELEKLKKDGLIKHLFTSCTDRLWTASRSCEEAGKNGLSNFPQEVERVQEALEDAMQLYHEWFRVSKAPDNGSASLPEAKVPCCNICGTPMVRVSHDTCKYDCEHGEPDGSAE